MLEASGNGSSRWVTESENQQASMRAGVAGGSQGETEILRQLESPFDLRRVRYDAVIAPVNPLVEYRVGIVPERSQNRGEL